MRPHALLRWTLSFVAALLISAASGGAVLADTSQGTVDFSILASAAPAVCSFTASAVGRVNATRTNDQWDTVNATGKLTLTFDTTGAPGDRDCYATGSNTNFLQGSDVFLLSYALSLTYNGNLVYLGSTRQNPISLTIHDIPATGGMAFLLDWSITGLPPASAPVGTYRSTLTITLSNTTI